MKKILFICFVCLTVFVACDLTETQKSTADAALIFGSETGLQTYCYSFYDILPSGSTAYSQDEMADYLAKTSLETYEMGALTPDNSKSWSWSDIRKVNYFLDHNHYDSVPEEVRNHYNGIARFFRALLYYSKLANYGEVPWVDHVPNPGDPVLTAPRDSRDVIIQHIMEDCDYAYENIRTLNGRDCKANLVNRYCAMLLKSRVCLFEASWRKYHAGTEWAPASLIMSPEYLFSEAEKAALEVIQSGEFSLHDGKAYEHGRGSYRDLFSSGDCPTDEVMLAISTDETLSAGRANYYFNRQGVRPSLTRPFMNTYLNLDGSFYSEKKADGKYKTFLEETQGRDLRLNQTIRAWDYTRKNSEGVFVSTLPKFDYTLTVYQIIKYTQDDVKYDEYSANGNDMPVMRYAEVLLNYAEAKAELGTLTDADWKMTIGALRRRAGITGGDLDTKPTVIDPYFKNTYFPSISDPVILEIRRERTIELCLEGFRLKDLKRWACGKLWQDMDWTGIWIPGFDEPMDMNGDGEYDVCYPSQNAPSTYADIAVNVPNNVTFDNVGGGKIMRVNLGGRRWYDKMYLNPIASEDIAMNPNLAPNNPGYDNN